MSRANYLRKHRAARKGNLSTLACCLCASPYEYQWFLHEVYDLRFPHVGDNRHALNGRNFDSLNGGFRLRRWLRLAVGRRAA